MNKLSLSDIDLKNKKVLMRVDFNVPLNDDLSIADDFRIRCALESIKYILEKGGSVVLMSHLGRPKGEKNPKLSLSPCAKRLSQLLKLPVKMANDCIGENIKKEAAALKPGEILLLENLRFHEAEEKPEKDPSFAKELASLGDVYINDAFGTAHRKHSSTYEIVKFFPDRCAMGFLVEKEVKFLTNLLTDPKRPFYAILGGAKISTKIGVITQLLEKVDALFIGGAMAFTFLKAKDLSIGDSLIEEDQLSRAQEILQLAQTKKIPLYLPEDIVIAQEVKENAKIKIVTINEGIDKGWKGMDIGPETRKKWKEIFKTAKTIFWNGPVGIFEIAAFAQGTKEIADSLAQLSATTIVGGGDSVAAIRSLRLESKFTHLSTGGGASLEFIEQGHLPGVDALANK